ncbi:DUF7504 family protein [Haloarcula salina]|uniref:Uncharacterized protein n=1 Tax=Haloarcula salina TaxID=1429914 RepID=A0AA41FXK2_9EURY|nr:hypothetical protein [Haloarcula salina]MBV0900456.1 hypothetical protein [Haloarcula salina]
MTARQDDRYAFDGLPLGPVDPGTSVIVTGPVLDGARELGLRLLRCDDGDCGVVIIAADSGAATTAEDFERYGGTFDRNRVGVVDCAQDGREPPADCVSAVGTPADLTGIGIEYSGHYERLYAAGYERVRTGILTVTPLLVYSEDVRPVYRFLNTVTGRIDTAGGVGACVVDPKAHDEQVVESLVQCFDGRIHVRSGDEGLELRVDGLPDQPTDWTAVDPAA